MAEARCRVARRVHGGGMMRILILLLAVGVLAAAEVHWLRDLRLE